MPNSLANMASSLISAMFTCRNVFSSSFVISASAGLPTGTVRSTSLDELPSFINLLRGEITLVGPRPLPVHYWSRYTTEQLHRLEVKPGITGLAQVAGRNAVDWPERLALDVQYVRQRSLRLDVSILLRTIPLVFGRRGVDHAAGVTMPELPQQHAAGSPGSTRADGVMW